jgi:hypothetical protein
VGTHLREIRKALAIRADNGNLHHGIRIGAAQDIRKSKQSGGTGGRSEKSAARDAHAPL